MSAYLGYPSRRLHIQVDEDDIAWLKSQAKKEGKSISDLLRKIVKKLRGLDPEGRISILELLKQQNLTEEFTESDIDRKKAAHDLGHGTYPGPCEDCIDLGWTDKSGNWL